MRTCIKPDGYFQFGIHKPSYTVRNLRHRTRLDTLGTDENGESVKNQVNYPDSDLEVEAAEWIYEIANPFPFRGTTFISKKWADSKAADPASIRLEPKPTMSMSRLLADNGLTLDLIDQLPRPILFAIATSSSDADDLVRLAHLCCKLDTSSTDGRIELNYKLTASNRRLPDISDHDLFEAVANNPALPDPYKVAMVVRPGAQGVSEIVGDYQGEASHIYEYLRRNSYIAGGHYAANMADDAIRYDIGSLSRQDMHGLRLLYYQRTYARLADELGISLAAGKLDDVALEKLRQSIVSHPDFNDLPMTATLWGWNFGFDFSPTGYRLHASHQQIHQQYAMIPGEMELHPQVGQQDKASGVPFSAGDMIAESIAQYQSACGRHLFQDYLQALQSNERMDGRRDRDKSLVIWQDDRVMLFVPKAQVSQWEIQVMTKPDKNDCWPGNILETDRDTRESLDTAILMGQKALAGIGARMVTSIEYGKRFQGGDSQHPLLYALLPKIPYSPGALSETQMRFINGHYPEDFAAACRLSLQER